jgi:Zn-dependent protease
MPISNMQQARQMYNQGGYADMGLMAPRQGYGFGSFVKKAVRGVKKVVKSPLGKAAIAGAIGFGIPGTSFGGLMGRAGMFGGQGATGMFGTKGLGSIFGNAGKFSKVGDMFRKDGAGSALSYGKLGLGALGAASVSSSINGWRWR